MHEEKITATELETARPDHSGEILSIIRGDDTPRAMLQKLEDYHENDISEVIPQLSDAERKKLFRVCSPEILSAVLEHLDDAQAGAYLAEMDLKKASKVVAELETDTAAAVLHELDKEKRDILIDALSPDIKKEILLSFAFVGLYIFLMKHKPLGFSYAVSGCIGFSLLLAMVVSTQIILLCICGAFLIIAIIVAIGDRFISLLIIIMPVYIIPVKNNTICKMGI